MTADLDRDGPAAPPRRNGELVFAAPWERRLFGVTMALHERGVFAWGEFSAHLIDEIALDGQRRHRQTNTSTTSIGSARFHGCSTSAA
jgi:hypothetical protein